jgi:hypothetical protein
MLPLAMQLSTFAFPSSVGLQVASTGVYLLPASAALTPVQRLSDQFFQTLGHGSSGDTDDPIWDSLAGSGVLQGRKRMEIAGSELSRAPAAALAARGPEQQGQIDAAALDQYFARSPDEAEPAVADD